MKAREVLLSISKDLFKKKKKTFKCQIMEMVIRLIAAKNFFDFWMPYSDLTKMKAHVTNLDSPIVR